MGRCARRTPSVFGTGGDSRRHVPERCSPLCRGRRPGGSDVDNPEEQTMFDFLRRERGETGAPEKKASATGRVVAWGSSGRVAWSPRDVASLTRSGFQGNPIGFRAVRLISEAAAALPLVLQDNERRHAQHPLLSADRAAECGAGAGGISGGALRLSAADRQRLCRGGAGGRASAGRVACAALGPDEPGAGGGWLAGGL